MLFRLSEVGETGSSGAGGSSRGLSGQSFLNDYEQARQVEADVLNAGNAIGGITDRDVPIVLPLAIIGGGVDFLVNFFEDIFGGGESPPPIPRQLRHHRHPLYPVILGIQDGLIPDEGSSAPRTQLGMRPLSSDALDELLPPHIPGPLDLLSSKVGTEVAAGVITDLIVAEALPHPIAAILGEIVAAEVGEHYVPPSSLQTSLGRVLVPELFGTPTAADFKSVFGQLF